MYYLKIKNLTCTRGGGIGRAGGGEERRFNLPEQ